MQNGVTAMASPEWPEYPRGEFTLFPRLPYELRLMIWENICSEERIIPILPGIGHLVPFAHPTLAVPPILHVCSEARDVGLKHYNLSFHPRLYANRNRDHLLVHVFYPHQIIDFELYFHPRTEFNWKKAPRRLAALLDDISFQQDHEDMASQVWSTDPPTWRNHLKPVSSCFASSIRLHFPQFDEIALLVLPPLTARPNPVVHHFSFIRCPDAPAEFPSMSQALSTHLDTRIQYRFNTGSSSSSSTSNSWITPPIRVRPVNCSMWPPPLDANNLPALGPLRDSCSPAYYADMQFSCTDWLPGPGEGDIGHFTPRPQRICGIARDCKLLRKPFSRHTGLGPQALWERVEPMGEDDYSDSEELGPIYNAEKRPLWASISDSDSNSNLLGELGGDTCMDPAQVQTEASSSSNNGNRRPEWQNITPILSAIKLLAYDTTMVSIGPRLQGERLGTEASQVLERWKMLERDAAELVARLHALEASRDAAVAKRAVPVLKDREDEEEDPEVVSALKHNGLVYYGWDHAAIARRRRWRGVTNVDDMDAYLGN